MNIILPINLNRSQPISRPYKSAIRGERAAKTVREILTAARKLFASHGYAATSLSQIADEVGVSVQTLYNSVGGKAQILLALNGVIDETAQVVEIQRKIA